MYMWVSRFSFSPREDICPKGLPPRVPVDGKDPCLLIHYRLNDIVPGERGSTVEGLPAYWTACVAVLDNASVPHSTKHDQRHKHFDLPNRTNKLRTLCGHTE